MVLGPKPGMERLRCLPRPRGAPVGADPGAERCSVTRWSLGVPERPRIAADAQTVPGPWVMSGPASASRFPALSGLPGARCGRPPRMAAAGSSSVRPRLAPALCWVRTRAVDIDAYDDASTSQSFTASARPTAVASGHRCRGACHLKLRPSHPRWSR
jgi:hypothetical protein